MDPIELTTGATAGLERPGPEAPRRAGGSGFSSVLGEVLEQANQRQIEAEKQARSLAEGKGDIVDTMIALNRAELALRFVVNLRNRAVQAYQEVMRLQV